MKTPTTAAYLALVAFMPATAFGTDALTDVRWTPDPNETQKSLTKITVQFMEANWGISGHVDVSGITLTRRNSTETLYALSDPVVDYAKLTLEFGYKGDTEPTTITTDGIYTLHIPAGAVSAMSSERPNAEINQDFTINSNAVTPMTAYTLTPQAGTVNEISTVSISFPESGGIDWFHNDLYGKGSFSKITIYDKSNPATVYTAVKESFDKNATVKLSFVKQGSDEKVAITTPGTYILDIPADMFRKDYTSIGNDHISEEYVIKSAMPAEFLDVDVTPQPNTTIGQLSELTLRFPNLPDGLDYPVSNIGQVTIETPDGEKFFGFNARVGGTGYNTLTLSFAPEGTLAINNALTFTGAGTYTVTFPEGTLKAYGTEIVNSEFSLIYNVDPLINFTYTADPEDGAVAGDFPSIVFRPGNSINSIMVNTECAESPYISDGTTRYDVDATTSADGTVVFSVLSDGRPAPGTWVLTIPARFFYGPDSDGRLVYNPEPLSHSIVIKEAQNFEYVVMPSDGDTVEFFKNVTIAFEGDNLKSIGMNPETGTPVLTGETGVIYPLEARISGNYAIFLNRDGVNIPDGAYTLAIPEGFLYTIDRDNLRADVAAINSTLRIDRPVEADYTKGILVLNEGWFGHDSGSLNFLGNDGVWVYDAYLRNNPDHRLGITSQYGQCFGNNIYIVSKQVEGDDAGDGGVLTVLDASTLRFSGEIHRLPDDQTQPRAFCAWNRHKGYLSTRDRIYAVDLDNLEVISVVEGTDKYTSFDSNGEMLRYGDYIFAVRESSGVDAIDPENDNVVKIPAELTAALVVTPDGSLYAATRNENNEFIKISPETLLIDRLIDIEGNKVKIANTWKTWRKSPIAADRSRNVVYYVTQKALEDNPQGVRSIAMYDFDNDEFVEKFITLPGVDDGETADWVLYGEGVSVDPATGNILLTAVEAGSGIHYSRNRIFVVDPLTGEIIASESHRLDDGFWFPAMTLYPDFQAPEIDTSLLSLTGQPARFSLDVASATTIASGNPHLICYSAKTLSGTADIRPTLFSGIFDVRTSDNTPYEIEVTADYQGKSTTVILSNISSDVHEIQTDSTTADVYNLQGIRILSNATEPEIHALPAGIYIINGRKTAIR